MNIKDYKLKRPKDGYNNEKERAFAKWSGVSDWEVWYDKDRIGSIYYVGTNLVKWGWYVGKLEIPKGDAPTKQSALEELKIAYENFKGAN